MKKLALSLVMCFCLASSVVIAQDAKPAGSSCCKAKTECKKDDKKACPQSKAECKKDEKKACCSSAAKCDKTKSTK